MRDHNQPILSKHCRVYDIDRNDTKETDGHPSDARVRSELVASISDEPVSPPAEPPPVDDDRGMHLVDQLVKALAPIRRERRRRGRGRLTMPSTKYFQG